jgi:hypothetical protein
MAERRKVNSEIADALKYKIHNTKHRTPTISSNIMDAHLRSNNLEKTEDRWILAIMEQLASPRSHHYPPFQTGMREKARRPRGA